MNINKIFLLNFNDTNDFNIKQVAIENDKVVSFSKSIKNISEYGMKNYFDLAESLVTNGRKPPYFSEGI